MFFWKVTARPGQLPAHRRFGKRSMFFFVTVTFFLGCVQDLSGWGWCGGWWAGTMHLNESLHLQPYIYVWVNSERGSPGRRMCSMRTMILRSESVRVVLKMVVKQSESKVL